jgi:hypothetical protein
MCVCSSELLTTCYDGGGTSGTDTILQVNDLSQILPKITNALPPVESNLIQRVICGETHRITGNKSFGRLT